MADRYKYLHDASKELRRKTKMCLAKKAYDTKEEAEVNHQRVYKCPHCYKWHCSNQLNALIDFIRHAKKKKLSKYFRRRR